MMWWRGIRLSLSFCCWSSITLPRSRLKVSTGIINDRQKDKGKSQIRMLSLSYSFISQSFLCFHVLLFSFWSPILVVGSSKVIFENIVVLQNDRKLMLECGYVFMNQELIRYRYSSCCCSCWERLSFIKTLSLVLSNRIEMKFGKVVLHCLLAKYMYM